MGLMDKFKNLFTDEEIIEEDEAEPIEIKEVKKEEEVNKLPTFMREKLEKENQSKTSISENEPILKEEIEIKKELKLEPNPEEDLPKIKKIEEKNTFKFPIEFTDNDFIETRSRQSMHSREQSVISSTTKESYKKEPLVKKEPKVAELYKEKKKETIEERKFKATPIISPIYGVLDKNYTPTDMESSKGENLENHRHSKNVDFDSVRKKAYGNLSEEIRENLMCENCEYLKEVKECKREKEANLVYDVLEEPETNYSNNITLDEATENYYDYGVEYEKKIAEPDEVKIINHGEESHPPKKEIPPVKSSINLLSTLKKSMGEEPQVEPQAKDLELTDDLFNLIDSMYDERNESK